MTSTDTPLVVDLTAQYDGLLSPDLVRRTVVLARPPAGAVEPQAVELAARTDVAALAAAVARGGLGRP